MSCDECHDWNGTRRWNENVNVCKYNKLLMVIIILICPLMVGKWTLDYLCPTHIVMLDSYQIPVENRNERGSHVVKGPYANQHQTEQRVLLFVVHIPKVLVSTNWSSSAYCRVPEPPLPCFGGQVKCWLLTVASEIKCFLFLFSLFSIN